MCQQHNVLYVALDIGQNRPAPHQSVIMQIAQFAFFAQTAYSGRLEKRGCMDMADTVPAAEFARNFGRYKLQAQREAVPVSSNGTLAGYFVAPHEYEELRKLKGMRRRFLTAELSDEEAERIAASRMDPRHDHLNKLLDPT
jgi:hypothetical protein